MAIARAEREAGLEATREPDTYGLLMEEFIREQCRRIFPKDPPKRYKLAFDLLYQATEFVRSPECKMRKEDKDKYIQHRLDALPPLNKRDTKGLRIDIDIVNPITGEVRWVDVSAVNPASFTYVKQEINHITNRDSVKEMLAGHSAPLIRPTPSPALRRREAFKRDKYANLVTIANRQHAQGKRPQKPLFTTFAITTTGELGDQANSLLDWIVQQYVCPRRAQVGRPNHEGACALLSQEAPPNREMASGTGLTINQAGLPKGEGSLRR
jgi:hypothetical protein